VVAQNFKNKPTKASMVWLACIASERDEHLLLFANLAGLQIEVRHLSEL
jgi:hypothetical protein